MLFLAYFLLYIFPLLYFLTSLILSQINVMLNFPNRLEGLNLLAALLKGYALIQ